MLTVFERTFIMTGIENMVKAKDNASVFVFGLLDEHAYISKYKDLTLIVAHYQILLQRYHTIT